MANETVKTAATENGKAKRDRLSRLQILLAVKDAVVAFGGDAAKVRMLSEVSEDADDCGWTVHYGRTELYNGAGRPLFNAVQLAKAIKDAVAAK